MVPMRDGIQFATDVYRLDGAAPAPVLLARTPYNKERALVGSIGGPFDILRRSGWLRRHHPGYAWAVCLRDTLAPYFRNTADGVDMITQTDPRTAAKTLPDRSGVRLQGGQEEEEAIGDGPGGPPNGRVPTDATC